jgi:hypothetical protein
MLRISHFLDNSLKDGGKFVSLTRRPPLHFTETLYSCFWYSFLLQAEAEAEWILRPSAAFIGYQTRDLPACSLVAAPLCYRVPQTITKLHRSRRDVLCTCTWSPSSWILMIICAISKVICNILNDNAATAVRNYIFTHWNTSLWTSLRSEQFRKRDINNIYRFVKYINITIAIPNIIRPNVFI